MHLENQKPAKMLRRKNIKDESSLSKTLKMKKLKWKRQKDKKRIKEQELRTAMNYLWVISVGKN